MEEEIKINIVSYVDGGKAIHIEDKNKFELYMSEYFYYLALNHPKIKELALQQSHNT